MKIITGSAQLPLALRGGVITLGNFDGVHRGHQALITHTMALSQRAQGPALAYTFDPHPAKVLAPEVQLLMLQTLEQRLRSLEEQGLDAVVVESFTPALAHLTARAFFHDILQARLSPRGLVIGHDFTYGHHRAGRPDTLQRDCLAAGITCELLPPVFLDDVLISSTYLRRLILQGHVASAAKALGRPFASSGQIVVGRGVGRTLGFPTLNLLPATELCPPEGIYITSASWGPDWEMRAPAATYIGHNPTFGGTPLAIETYLLTTTPPPLTTMEVHFHERLRGDAKFVDAQELQKQIARDVAAARAFHGIEP